MFLKGVNVFKTLPEPGSRVLCVRGERTFGGRSPASTLRRCGLSRLSLRVREALLIAEKLPLQGIVFSLKSSNLTPETNIHVIDHYRTYSDTTTSTSYCIYYLCYESFYANLI